MQRQAKSIGLKLLFHLNLQPKRPKSDWHKWGRTGGATEISLKLLLLRQLFLNILYRVL